MNKRALEKFKKKLEEEKGRVLRDLGLIEEEIDSLSSNKGTPGSNYSNHMADIGTDAMEQEQVFLHASQGSEYLKGLEAALKRIKDGTYGICEECGGKISEKRLEAYPAASLCISCKSKQEKLQRG